MAWVWFVMLSDRPATICSKELGDRGSHKKLTETEQVANGEWLTKAAKEQKIN